MKKIITKIKTELNDVFGITSIGKTKKGIIVYILAEDYRKMICDLLKDKLTLDEFEQVKIIVSGPILPAVDWNEMLEKIKELRELTNVSLAKCKKAIEDSGGNIEGALVLLQKLGLTDSAKKAGRTASEGLIHSYIHSGKIGVMVEVNCETDFLAKSIHFKEFVDAVVLQIASMNPQFISKDDVPLVLEADQKEIFFAQIFDKTTGKQQVIDKMLDGKFNKWLEEVCLLNQVSVLDSKKTIEQLRSDLVLKSGENIVIKRFLRWELGK